MANLNGFDATAVDPRGTFDAIPAGWYLCAIVGSESVATKAGTGTYLKLTLEILDGEFKGRKVWDNLNLDNPKPQTVEIAKATLSSICHAVGVLKPQASEELHDKPLLAKIGVREYQGEAQNDVKGYKAQGSGKSDSKSSGATKPSSTGNGNGNGAKPGKRRWQPNRLKRDEAAQEATVPASESGDEYEGDGSDE